MPLGFFYQLKVALLALANDEALNGVVGAFLVAYYIF